MHLVLVLEHFFKRELNTYSKRFAVLSNQSNKFSIKFYKVIRLWQRLVFLHSCEVKPDTIHIYIYLVFLFELICINFLTDFRIFQKENSFVLLPLSRLRKNTT